MDLMISKASESSFQVPVLMGLNAKIDLQLCSKPYSADCQISAVNDIEAVKCWLRKYQIKANTFAAYSRQITLFLMWCVYEKGQSINQLKAQDFEDFFAFLSCPPKDWCTSRSMLRQGKGASVWRPFVKGLSPSTLKMAFTILHSLMSYLNNSHYCKDNPLRLINLKNTYTQSVDEQKFKVWTRMLEMDEWKALQETLNELPEKTSLELQAKLRTQFLVALLYFLGLRIHEAVNHRWSAFQMKEGKWWFFVKGKGGKLGHVPVHDKLLSIAKLYRSHLNKSPLPYPDEETPLLVSLNKNPLALRQAYNLIKKLGALTALKFKNNRQKETKLKALSPHWLRHLCASHQDKAGISLSMIKENLRHGSIQTSQIYLHAEEQLRHEALQQMDLALDLKPKNRKVISATTLIKIKLTKGPIHKSLGFKKLIQALELAFASYQWQAYQFEKSEIIKEIDKAIYPNQEINFAYHFIDLRAQDIEIIKQTIDREASIRLFKVVYENK
ncbi:MAG: hypothetical protein JWM09_1422 [Francisellaceae bacterium]|nr:hypothetical protein [Francisellaceae bacterium]